MKRGNLRDRPQSEPMGRGLSLCHCQEFMSRSRTGNPHQAMYANVHATDRALKLLQGTFACSLKSLILISMNIY